MLYDETQSAQAGQGDLGSAREIEFAQALDRYIASYAAEQRRRQQRRNQGFSGWRLIASALEATGDTLRRRLGGRLAARRVRSWA